MFSEYLAPVIILTIVGAVWSLAWWLSSQFNSIRNLVYSEMKKLKDSIMTQLDYHEKHDDQRFHEVTNDIWDIRVRNAARDGLEIKKNTRDH